MQRGAATRSLRLLSTTRHACLLPCTRASSSTARTADRAVHSEDPQGEEEAKASVANKQEQQQQNLKEHETNTPLRTTCDTTKPLPFGAVPKLESTEVTPPDPRYEQKRRSHVPDRALDDVSCVGWDGGVGEVEGDDQEEEYKEYYKNHKASPLSEVEFVDTRKPITRAWDHGEAAEEYYGVIVEDTVDAALLRAEIMFREAAERGDPDSPQARALARARGEYR